MRKFPIRNMKNMKLRSLCQLCSNCQKYTALDNIKNSPTYLMDTEFYTCTRLNSIPSENMLTITNCESFNPYPGAQNLLGNAKRIVHEKEKYEDAVVDISLLLEDVITNEKNLDNDEYSENLHSLALSHEMGVDEDEFL